MTNQEIVLGELMLHGITLCSGGCGNRRSHKRGFAAAHERIIHLDSKFATRSTLYRFLHEVGHVVNGHDRKCGKRRFEKEREAEDYARASLRQYGVRVPSSMVRLGNAYVARLKRFGDRISASLKRAS